ncbi:MAG TPA: S53 family peptidase, partial [Candidatus Acidoferrum sp.]
MELSGMKTHHAGTTNWLVAVCKNTMLALLIGSAALTATSADAQELKGNTPKFVAKAQMLGRENTANVIDVSVWLKLHDRAALDSLAKDLYNPSSPNYRHWLKQADFSARFGPTSADVKAVSDFFAKHNLKVVTVGPGNLFVRARGTVGDVEAAFKVHVNDYLVNGKTLRSNSGDPSLEAAIAPLVHHVSGMDNAEYSHPVATRVLPTSGGSKSTAAANASYDGAANFFENYCFQGSVTEKFDTAGGFPKATFTGNNLYSSLTGPGCGYGPNDIQKAYGLTSLYKEGFDGTGQTVVIIDWCGSNTILQDANAFSAKFGLPALTSSNFQVIETPIPSTCAGPSPEINIDVEWAHAIAPGAAIDLVVPPSASFQDVNQAVFYAVNYGLGNVISGSYGSEEQYTSPQELATEDLINEIAALSGISANFSSGDYGDFTFGFDTPSVSAPADSPWATAIGGVSLALNSNGSIKWQAGWGNNVTLLQGGGQVFDPPLNFGFNGGSGGGESGFFLKPSYQSSLPGLGRQVPDISWLADPFTGGIIAITTPGQFPPITYTVYGGTSLACPMFSALWAIANQEAGVPLGQAAPYLYSLPAATIHDIKPLGSPTNVRGTVYESTGSTYYSTATIAGVPTGTTVYSAFWEYPGESYTWYVLTFGTDSSLTVTPGWDNVTGL